MMQKMTLIYTESVGSPWAGGNVTKIMYFEAPAKCSTNELMRTINEAGYKTHKPGFEHDIADSMVFLFYGHVEHVR